jgi:hypothetical protein
MNLENDDGTNSTKREAVPRPAANPLRRRHAAAQSSRPKSTALLID